MEEKKKKIEDLRRHRRLDADYLIRYQAGSEGENPRITNIKNLSAGGAKFLTGEILDESATVVVTILIPPLEKSFQTRARVLRVRRTRRKFIYSVAVRFTDISPEDQTALNRFVETLEEDADVKGKFLVDLAITVSKELKDKGKRHD